MAYKYPCKRKDCKNKQINGKCRFKEYIPVSESKCKEFRPRLIGKGD